MLTENKLQKIKEFLEVLDQMINGKYILADVKINKLVKIINESEELYKFMSECLINFDFEKEYSECMPKNRINGEGFTLPKEPIKIVALVYCLLNAFNSKYLDLYDFMRENFSSIQYHTEYLEFGRRIIEPFKNIVASYFGLNEDGKSLIDYQKEMGFVVEEKAKEEKEEPIKVDKRFITIHSLIKKMIEKIKSERKIKAELKDNLVYILNRTIYALNYQDIELVTPIITIFDIYAKKIKTIAWEYNDLKVEIMKFYNESDDVYSEDDLVSKEELDEYMNDANEILSKKQ